MKKYVKKLFATLLVIAMIATDALPAAAANEAEHSHASHVTMSGIDMSALSDKALEFLAEYTASEDVKSAFGKTVEGYNTDALKDAIWEAIFVKRDASVVNFEALGISQETADALTAEVLAESNAEEAVTYSVKKDANGDATVMEVQIDPLYETAYDEIDAGTANTRESEGASTYARTASVSEEENEIMVLAEEGDAADTEGSEGTEGEGSTEQTMKEAYAAFDEYQQFINDNPDYFGITVPYTSVKDDANEGGGPITSLITIANSKMMVDMDGDGTAETETTLLDMFKAGYVPASDIIQIIQMFHMGNQLAVNMLGSELLATKDEALAVVPDDATDEQKLLILNDWMADKATFDMARIMELEAPEPETPAIYTQVVGALQQQGLPEADAQSLAQQLMGLWGGNQFGVMTDSMGHKGVCMSYTYAYAYLVQWAFDEVYKNEDGSWKTRLELNYIVNPDDAVAEEVALVSDVEPADGEEDTDEDASADTHTHVYAEPTDADWTWSDDNTSATVTVGCTVDGCEEVYTKTVTATPATTKEATCQQKGEITYTTEAVTINEQSYTATKTVETELGSHTYVDGVCEECGAEEVVDDEHVYGTPVFTWADDNLSATATATCTDEGCEEAITVDAPVQVTTTAATCTEDGKTEYVATAVINGIEFTEKKEEVIPATGHIVDETVAPSSWTWAEDYSTAKAVYNCTVEGCTGTKEVDAAVASTTTTTCTEDGVTTYTASVTVGEGETAVTYTDVKEVETAATGHQYGEDDVCTVCGSAHYVWDPSAAAMVDYVRITYDTEVTMYGESQGNLDSDHYWNAVKVNGQWYYVDPCYTDIYVECMIRDRVETDGNMSHLYFMFSDTNARTLYDGNFSGIDTLYENIATDTTYEDAWFAFARSPIYKNGSNYYYFYDSTDMISLKTDSSNSYNQDTEYKLVYHDGTKADSDASYTTLIDFVEGEVRVVGENGTATMQANDLIADLYAEHEAYQEKYPSIGISCDMEGTRLYFNISNCILYYDIETSEVVKVFEYNEVTAERDLSEGLGGIAFSVINPNEAETAAEAETSEELTTLTVKNNPIASMTIKDGNMYVSVGTTIGFISGKESMSEEDTSIGYQFEETNYNPDYTEYIMSEGQMGEEEENDNDEFMWSANFVDTISMEHITSDEHTYEEVYVEATCGKNAYTENRCTECGAIEAGTRVEIEDTALDHHFVKFDEQYYTKEGDAWNTGTCYVCTICKDAKDELEDGDHVGHVYTGYATAWNEDYTEATMDVACEACYGVNYDCVLADDTVVLAEDLTTTDITKERATEVDVVVDEATGEETEVKSYYWIYTATVEYEDVEYTDSIKVAREADKYDNNPFTDVSEDDWYCDAVLWAAENGITAGYEEADGTYTFRPTESSTRAHVVTFLWNKAGQPEPTTTDNPFSDVDEDQWYYKAVLWAAENGITAGYEDGTFRPNDICTRGHVVTFLWNSAGQPEATDTELAFPDVTEDDWYYNAVLWAAENGITAGYEDGTFRPTKDCTRAEIVQFLYNAYAEEE